MEKWTVSVMLKEFYSKLWKLHEEGSLDSNDDAIAVEALNGIDDALGR